ncbi:hypothetical protein ACR77J_07565 [Tissierella praeacuta]|uniref:hypothetical protein n=1 Tax=Tissierella praeacuta TaxID=43131 RepID=UPI003DA431AC
MKTYSNAEICKMIDNGEFKDGDRVYVVPADNRLVYLNHEFNKNNGLYNLDSYYEYEEWRDVLESRNMNPHLWSPEKGTRWTINEKIY